MNEFTGALVVSATTARGAMPVAGARVTVTPTDEAIEPQTAQTNESGRTPPFVLPAPPPYESQIPEQPHPYAVYTVRVEAPGFRPVEPAAIAIFANVDATLPVDLVPNLGATGSGV